LLWVLPSSGRFDCLNLPDLLADKQSDDDSNDTHPPEILARPARDVGAPWKSRRQHDDEIT
jgi:hypothetical protein